MRHVNGAPSLVLSTVGWLEWYAVLKMVSGYTVDCDTMMWTE